MILVVNGSRISPPENGGAITSLCSQRWFRLADPPGEVIIAGRTELSQEQNDVADRIIDYSGSPFRWGWVLCRSSIPLLWRGPQPDTCDHHFGPSI